MRFIYSLCLCLLLPVTLLRLGWRGLGLRAYWHRWPERFGRLPHMSVAGPVIWLHAVSVGEARASIPLLEGLRTRYPDLHVHITTVTPTGSAVVQGLLDDRTSHSYLPYDLPFIVKRFLAVLEPALVIIMETEIWPNLFHYSHAVGARIFMVNSRISDRSFSGYRRLGRLTAAVLANVTHAAAQGEVDAGRLKALGLAADRITITGNLKFDIRLPAEIKDRGELCRHFLSSTRPMWLAASTHKNEESLLLQAQQQIKKKFPECLLVLAPRHPQRFDTVAAQVTEAGLNMQRYSEQNRDNAQVLASSVEVYLLDTMGQLLEFYAATDLAFVGGSLVAGTGGHNVLEPASLGCPVLTGPFTGNFREINRLLCDNNALLVVQDVAGLVAGVCRLLSQQQERQVLGTNAHRVCQNNQGATGRVLDLITADIENHVTEIN